MRCLADSNAAFGSWSRDRLGVLPSPLWGGVGGGGTSVREESCVTASPPSPPLPHKGGGSRPNALLAPGMYRQRGPLFLLAALHHAGAVVVVLLDAPGGLAHFSGLAVALADRLLPRAAHTGLAAVAALREARRCKGGNREPQRQRRSPVFGSPVFGPTD